MVNYTCRGARPSVTTLPNEAVSLKGKQLRTLSCVPAWLKLVKTVDFGSVHALFVFYSVIHFQQAIFCCCTAIWNLVSRPLRPFRPLQPCVLGYSLDKVYQVGIAKSFKLKPCRTNYPHDSTRPIWNQLQFLKPVPGDVPELCSRDQPWEDDVSIVSDLSSWEPWWHCLTFWVIWCCRMGLDVLHILQKKWEYDPSMTANWLLGLWLKFT